MAGEAQVYDGPWDVPDALRKVNGVVRYSQGTALDGFSVTGMAYASRWTATNQIASRAVTEGLIGRFGTLNPTDGGDSSRFSLSGRWSMTDDTGITRASAYVIRQQLNLFNDFTYFLNDPVNGDQFHQLDQRILGGGEVSHVFQGDLFGLPMENEVGVQTRTDSIRVGLFNTVNRQFRSGVLDDRVLEASGAFFYDNRVRWTDWLRTSVGFRADGYYADVVSDTAANTGKARDGIVNPKLGLVLGPWADTELYLNYGGGFHSNDVRGVTATVDPASPLFNIARSPFLVPSTGLRGRHPQPLDRRTGDGGRAVPPRLRVGEPVPGRHRHHGAEPPEPPLRRRVDQPLRGDAVAEAGRRPDRHQRPLLGRRHGRQPHPRGADHHRVGRLHLRRGSRAGSARCACATSARAR